PPPILTLTDDDIGRGTAGPQGVARLIARLEQALRAGDVDGAMALVHLQGASAEVRQAMRESFEQLIARPLAGIDLEPASAEDVAPVERDGVTYVPNLEVGGKLVVRLEPGEGEDEPTATTFLVGERLGTYFIAAAVEME
ncbi:MAG: hypothetical protein D6696_03800, partial [Acidobacteria bacterium]